MTRPRITSRCEADLEAQGITAATDIVDKFAELRTHAPGSGEPIVGLAARPCTSLHAGRYRAVTWYDRERETIWLLAAGIHRADSREDVYNQAIILEQAGRLYPTSVDYARLAADERRLRVEYEASDLASLRDQVLVAADGVTRSYTSVDDLYAEIWAEVIIGLDESEVVLRLRMRRGTTWLVVDELDILLAKVFAGHPVREQGEEDYLFRRFAAYFPLPAEH